MLGPEQQLDAAEHVDLKPARDYLVHLHNYIYNLKKEAEERAKSILTAIAFYVAALMWIIKFASDNINENVPIDYLPLAALIASALGFLTVAVSLVFTFKTFSPQIIDASSPMEPLEIQNRGLAGFSHCCLSVTEKDVIMALSREIYAVSKIQIRRSSYVQSAGRFFVLALMIFGATLILMVAIFILR